MTKLTKTSHKSHSFEALIWMESRQGRLDYHQDKSSLFITLREPPLAPSETFIVLLNLHVLPFPEKGFA